MSHFVIPYLLYSEKNPLVSELTKNSVLTDRNKTFLLEIYGLTIPLPKKPESVKIEEGRIIIS